jgi:hypothetical protein
VSVFRAMRTQSVGGLHCLAHSSLLLSQQKSRCYIKFVKWLVRKNRALSMSKNDDEINEFIDEVTDGAYNLPCVTLRWENRPANRPANRETGLEMPCCPASDLLWVQITQSYPNRLRFSSLHCPQSPCHAECLARLVQTFPDL